MDEKSELEKRIIELENAAKTATSVMSLKTKIIISIVTILAIVALGAVCYNFYYNYSHKEIQYTKQSDILTSDGVKTEAKKAGVNISDAQAKESSNWISDIQNGKVKPNYVVTTDGNNYKEEVEKQSKANDADVTFVTDPANPDKVPDPKKGDVVVLNQYNQQFYPKKQVGVTVYNDQSVAVDYNQKVKVFGTTFYAGPSVMYDGKNKDMKIGVRITKNF